MFLLCLALSDAYSQAKAFSLATDIGLQRSFKKEQRFLAGGHTVQAQFHFSDKDALYAWIAYYTNGKFSNEVTANAKSPLTIPQQVNYRNNSLMRFKHLSIGWKKYLKGDYKIEDGYNIYGYAGFGLMLGRVENTHSVVIDTSQYQLPVLAGQANFKRLTFDIGTGVEFPIGAEIFFYSEVRAWIPSSDYPSKHIFVNNNAPLVAMVNAGLRIMFD